MAQMVSMDFLFYVTDFIVDELSQNSHLASEIKLRVRAAAQNFPHGDTEGEGGQAGAKRKGAPGGSAGLGQFKAVKLQDIHTSNGYMANGPSNEEPAGKKKVKKKRLMSGHSVFVSAAMESLPPDLRHSKKNAFGSLGKWKKSVDPKKLESFNEDYKPVLTALNGAAERTPDDLKISVRNRTKELGLEHHAVFDGLEDFVREHAPAEDSDGKEAAEAEKPSKVADVKKDEVPDKDASAPAAEGKKKKGKGSPTKRQKAAQEDTATDKASAGASKSKKKAKDIIPKPAAAKKVVKQQASEDTDDDDDGEEEEAPLPTKGKPKGKFIVTAVETSKESGSEDDGSESESDNDSNE